MTSILAPRTLHALPLLASAIALASCSGGGGDENPAFQPSTSRFAVASGTPLVIEDEWIAFLADEASSGGQDLNGDGAVVDQVAVVVNNETKTETNLGVAAIDLAWVGPELYLVVDEVFDDHDWGGTANPVELVLLHWNSTLDRPELAATLDRGSDPSMVAVGGTLFYTSDETPAGEEESSLFAIDVETPGLGRPVFTRDGDGGLSPRLIGADEGLLFLALDEETEGRSLNADVDTEDTVLALLDGTGTAYASGYDRTLRSTGLAISGVDSPYRASYSSGDWLVGFLVDEHGEGENLNLFDGNVLPPSWQVAGCADDADTADHVLHVIHFHDWDIGPTAAPPVNTGIVGTDRVLIAGDAVATISLESDEHGCPLNGDGDDEDRVLRWFRDDGNGPVNDTSLLLALDAGLPGGAMAVAEIDGAFVIQCDEAADGRGHDGDDDTDRELVAWLDPQDASPVWTFDHGLDGGTSWVTATWMSELPLHTRLGVAFAESSNGVDLNGDGDVLDSVPTFADLSGTPPRLGFPGFERAVVPDNAGISLANGWGFYRVDEAADGRDLNGNGNEDDILLVRSNLTSGLSYLMGALNSLPRSAVESEPDGIGLSGAYIFDERIIGSNLSGDSDAQDLVVRYFTFQ